MELKRKRNHFTEAFNKYGYDCIEELNSGTYGVVFKAEKSTNKKLY